MQIELAPYLIAWALLAVTVAGLIAWRKTLTWHSDNTLKLLDVGAVSQQVTVTHKLDLIDRWGKILTAITVIFGLMIAGLYAYQSWLQSFSAL